MAKINLYKLISSRTLSTGAYTLILFKAVFNIVVVKATESVSEKPNRLK